MLLKYIVIILLLTAPACGKAPAVRVQELLYKFEDDAARYSLHVDTDTLTVKFVDTIDGRFVGACLLITREIWLVKSFWRRASGANQESLMYHELGHCLLDRGHNDNNNGPYGLPSSIMRRTGLQGDVYETYRDYYLKELFQGG
jgi:hypothetical protein